MLDPISFLTPHKVTLCVLVRLSVQHDDVDDSEGERQSWLELALYLVEEVRSSAQYFEKSLDDVLLDLAEIDGDGVVAQSLTDELDKMDSPDALFSFLDVSVKEGIGDDGSPVERNSVFDVFIRKVMLSFHSMPFERFAALYTDLEAYKQAATEVGMEEDGQEAGRPPPLSVDDLHAHVHREARLLEVSTEPLALDHLETDIKEMMCVPGPSRLAACPALGDDNCLVLTRNACNRRLAEKVPKVLYLRFLRAMHSRDFAQALDDLHRYFDMFATGGINVQYAVLNLAALHLHFGHLEEAMHAINETVRVAQQSNDATALAFAVAWLLRVVQAQNGTRTTRRTASHDAKEEERMLRRCFSCASEEELPHLACITALASGRHVLTVGVPGPTDNRTGTEGDAADVTMAALPAAAWACQAAARHHARLALQTAQSLPAAEGDFSLAGLSTAGSRHGASANGFTVALWHHLGHTTLAHTMASLQLSHHSDDGLRQDTVSAACLVATQSAARAEYGKCFAMLREAFTILPAPEALVPRTVLSVMHARSLARSDLGMASAAVGELLALSASSVNAPHAAEALVAQAQVTLEANKLQLAFRQATELLHLHRCRGQTAELVPVLLLLGELHQHADSPVAALPHVLSCLSLCDVFSMELYRGYAIVMLAEIQLRLGAASAGLQMLHESLPLLLEHAPYGLQAHALLVVGNARLALASQVVQEMDAQARVAAAAEALEHSLKIFLLIEAYRRAKEVAYLLARAYHTLLTSKATVESGVMPVIGGKKMSVDDLRNARNRNAAEVRSLAAILQTTRGADGKRAAAAAAAAAQATAQDAEDDHSLNGSERRASSASALDVGALEAQGGPSHVRGVCEFLMDNHIDDSVDGESWISAASNDMSMMR